MRPAVFTSPAPPAASGDTALLGDDGPFAGVDFLTEVRLRTWARQHHCNAGVRHPDWHPVILDEMERIDREPVA